MKQEMKESGDGVKDEHDTVSVSARTLPSSADDSKGAAKSLKQESPSKMPSTEMKIEPNDVHGHPSMHKLEVEEAQEVTAAKMKASFDAMEHHKNEVIRMLRVVSEPAPRPKTPVWVKSGTDYEKAAKRKRQVKEEDDDSTTTTNDHHQPSTHGREPDKRYASANEQPIKKARLSQAFAEGPAADVHVV